MSEGEHVDSLIVDYETLLTQKLLKNSLGEYNESEILKELVVSADWSLSAAREILRLVENYGAFILRNALAIAVVLAKEDGSEGF
jgi:histone H3/H4